MSCGSSWWIREVTWQLKAGGGEVVLFVVAPDELAAAGGRFRV